MLTLGAGDGRTYTVDASRLGAATLAALRPGDRVTLFGVPRGDDKLVASGYIHTDPSTPAASSPSPR
jgi:hypothetical protein